MASEAKVKLVLQGEDRTGQAFSSASQGAKGFGSTVKGLLPVLGVAGLAGAIGTVIKQTADFEQQLSDVSTLISGDSTQAISNLRSGIQELLKETPKTAEELGAAAYQIVSAGISDTDDALKTLKASTRLAVSGLGSTEEATTLLATAMNAFGKDADEAEQVASILFNTVKKGQTNVAQLSQAFGKMAGNAAAANLTLEDVQAATAAITTVTGKTSETQNALAQVFLELTVAGGKLDKNLQEQGSSLGELNAAIQSGGGLVAGFEQVKNQLGLTDTQFKNMFSSAEGGTAVFQLLTSANGAYNDTLASGANSVAAMDEAVRKQNEQFNAQFQILKNNLGVELQKVAIQILPVLSEGMKFISEVWLPYMTEGFEKLTDSIGNFIFKVQSAIDKLKEFAKAVGSGVAGAFNKITDGIGGALFNAGQSLGFQEGGIVPGNIGQPQLALVHGGEEIIPAHRAGQGSRGGVTVNLSGTFLSERAAEEVGNLIVDRLRTQVRF